jgi:hypothetical protein
MRHNHESFDFEVVCGKKTWSQPAMTSVKLTAEELAEAGTTSESVGAFGRKLKAQGRL